MDISLDYFRQFRILDFSVFDFAISYIGVFILSPLLKRAAKLVHLHIGTQQWLWLTLPLSVSTNLLFKQVTPLTTFALDPSGHYLLKAILIGMIYLGLKDVRKNRL